MTLQMKLKNMMMIGKDRTVFRYFEQSKLQSKYIRQTVLLKLLCHHQTSRRDEQQAWHDIDNPVVVSDIIITKKKFDRDQDCKFSNFNGVIFFVKFVNENVFNMNNDISVINCFNVIK